MKKFYTMKRETFFFSLFVCNSIHLGRESLVTIIQATVKVTVMDIEFHCARSNRLVS